MGPSVRACLTVTSCAPMACDAQLAAARTMNSRTTAARMGPHPPLRSSSAGLGYGMAYPTFTR